MREFSLIKRVPRLLSQVPHVLLELSDDFGDGLLLMEVLFCLSLSRDTISSFDRPLLRNMVALWIFYYVKREDRASLGLLVP